MYVRNSFRSNNFFIINLNKEKYYVYVYLDPRKPGKYVYGEYEYEFEYEPFYIGKGSGRRFKRHLNEKQGWYRNPYKFHKIQAIQKEGMQPIIIKFYDKLFEEDAYKKELELINSIGLLKNDTGPLTNIVTNGESRFYNDKEKYLDVYKIISEKQKANWKNPNSIYNSKEFREKLLNHLKGKNNPRYGDHRNFEELHGKEKADELKKEYSESRKGKGNPNAKKWKLVSQRGEEFYVEGNLKNICDELNIFLSTLKKYIGTKVPKLKLYHKRYKEKSLNTIGWSLYEIE